MYVSFFLETEDILQAKNMVEDVLSYFGQDISDLKYIVSEKYYKIGSDEIALTNGQILTNPSNFTAKPIIKFDLDTIYGSGHISVSPTSGSGGGAIAFGALSDDDLIPIYTQNYTCIIDTATHQAIGKTEPETSYSSANGRITGAFEGLHLGKQMQIIWDGDIKNVRLVPLWWTI